MEAQALEELSGLCPPPGRIWPGLLCGRKLVWCFSNGARDQMIRMGLPCGLMEAAKYFSIVPGCWEAETGGTGLVLEQKVLLQPGLQSCAGAPLQGIAYRTRFEARLTSAPHLSTTLHFLQSIPRHCQPLRCRPLALSSSATWEPCCMVCVPLTWERYASLIVHLPPPPT